MEDPVENHHTEAGIQGRINARGQVEHTWSAQQLHSVTSFDACDSTIADISIQIDK